MAKAQRHRHDTKRSNNELDRKRISPEGALGPSKQDNICLKSFSYNKAGRHDVALQNGVEAQTDFDGGKHLVKTQKNINFKSIFKMNNSTSAYDSQLAPSQRSQQLGRHVVAHAKVPSGGLGNEGVP